MAARKPLFLASEGYSEEMALTDSMSLGGLTMGGNIVMSSNKITGLAAASGSGEALVYGQSGGMLNGLNVDTSNLSLTSGAIITGLPTVPTSGSDAVSKDYVDALITGLGWSGPCEVLRLIGNAAVATLNALGTNAGAAYVVTNTGTLTRGSVSVSAGDLVEDNGTSWVKLVANSGGFVPDGTRAILSGVDTLISPYTDGTDNDKIVEFDGTSNTGTYIDAPVDTTAVLIQDDSHVGYYDSLGFVYQGTVPAGVWVQFTGAATISAGAGLSKDGNTINVGAGNGITTLADFVAVDPDSETGGNIQPVNVTANGVGLDISAIAGTNLEADGSANLRISTSAAGNGLAGGGASALSVDPDSESGGNIQPVNVIANGVGVDISAVAGTGLEADGSANLRIAAAAAGNGLTGGGGSALAVDPDSETGGTVAPVNVTANGVGLDVDSIDGTGLEASGATLRIAATAAGNGLTGGGGSALSVDSDTETGGNIQGVNVTANGVGLDISAIAGTNLEADGSANLRIATSAAGNGLTGGGASALAVGAGNGISVAADTVSVDPDSESGGNIQPVNVAANGVGLDVNAIAGAGLEADGSANLRIAAAAAGDGLTGGGGSALAVNYDTNSLEIVTDVLGVKLNAAGGLQDDASGVAIKIDDTPDTLDVDGDGLKVVGLPSLFKINGTAVGATVTAANLDTLTDGSNADSLHIHGTGEATEAPKVENTLTTATDATTNGDPVYVNGAGTIGKATAATDVKARVIGVIRTGAGAAGATPEVVSQGICSSILTGATANTPYYLQAAGGIGTSLPAAGNRVILVGYAYNTTDLWVCIKDYGKLAA